MSKGLEAAKHDVRSREGAKTEGRTPFEVLGTVFKSNILTAEQALKAAKLDWTVEKRQLQYAGKNVDAYGIFRQDNDTFLGSVGNAYTPIQNVKGFEWPDALLTADNSGAHYVAAGEIDGGKKIFSVARIPSMDIDVGGKDKSHGYLIFENGHDGGQSAMIKVVILRLACMNGMVQVAREGSIYRVKHTKGAIARLDAAKEELATIQAQVKNLEKRMNSLARKKLDAPHVDKIMQNLFGENYLESQNWRKQAQVAKVAELFKINDNDVFPEQAGTAYNLFNAFTNYTDHHRQMRELDAPSEQRVQAAYFGTGVQQKQHALNVIELLTEDIPETKPTVKVDRDIQGMLDNILSKVQL